jgi:hypothetical protein
LRIAAGSDKMRCMRYSTSRIKASVRSLLLAALIVGVAFSSCSSKPITESEHAALPTEGSVPTGRPFSLEVGSHCGVGWLGLPVDGKFWITDEATNDLDWMPEEWAATQPVGAGVITITVELSSDREVLTASLAGRSVAYRPSTANDPTVECA